LQAFDKQTNVTTANMLFDELLKAEFIGGKETAISGKETVVKMKCEPRYSTHRAAMTNTPCRDDQHTVPR